MSACIPYALTALALPGKAAFRMELPGVRSEHHATRDFNALARDPVVAIGKQCGNRGTHIVGAALLHKCRSQLR